MQKLMARSTHHAIPLLTMLLAAVMVLPLATAEPRTLVQQLQMPAWIERGGERLPLRPDIELHKDDVIETGEHGRAWFVLGDGSMLKLGERTRLSIEGLELNRNDSSALDGIVQILRGVFRFTTPRKLNGRKRSMDIRLTSMTIGVRGTDVWGRALAQESLVCLIKGKISVQTAAGESIEMDQALTFARVSPGGSAMPVTPVPPEKLRQWATETEMAPAAGKAHGNGGWRVNLVSFQDTEAARVALKELERSGYAAELNTALIKGKTYYRLSIPYLDSRADAIGLGKRLTGHFGIRTPWADNGVR